MPCMKSSGISGIDCEGSWIDVSGQQPEKQILRCYAPQNDISANFNKLLRDKHVQLRPPKQFSEISVKCDEMLAKLHHSSGKPCVRNVVDGEVFSMHSWRSTGHSAPSDGISVPGTARSASRNPIASSRGVGCLKIFGFVTSRKKRVTTIGINFKLAPSAQAATALFRHA